MCGGNYGEGKCDREEERRRGRGGDDEEEEQNIYNNVETRHTEPTYFDWILFRAV
jgi:hypothetical protein